MDTHQQYANQCSPVPTARSDYAVDSRRYLDRLTSAERKEHPLCSGLLDYFPDALAVVASVSKAGNDKHNPGEPLHHARGKSTDHADCIARHLVCRGQKDSDGLRHTALVAWRALALLQEELEADLGLPLPRAARPAKLPTEVESAQGDPSYPSP